MPIYAYKCESCGHSKDVLQKMSDAPLTVCPNCGAATFAKQVTAAGFQLKGSGWYVTDFRNGGGATAAPATGSADKAAGDSAPASGEKGDKGDKGGQGAKATESPAPAPAPKSESAPAPAPAAGSRPAE